VYDHQRVFVVQGLSVGQGVFETGAGGCLVQGLFPGQGLSVEKGLFPGQGPPEYSFAAPEHLLVGRTYSTATSGTASSM
jgi:hypothetical protein